MVETKEEFVRQLVLLYLTKSLGYSSGRIAVEKQIKYGGDAKRFDIVIYDKTLNPFILIECKSFEYKLRQDYVYQASRYNIGLKAPYLCLTNGMDHLIALIDFHELKIEYLKDLPISHEI